MKTVKSYLALTVILLLSINFTFAQLETKDLEYPTLKQEYNAVKDQNVILSILGVNCPNCRAHRDQIRDQIMKDCENPDLRWLIVWFEDTDHAATRSDAVSQAAEVDDTRVKQWWFKEHSSSTPKNDSICYKFGSAVWLGCSYPWDISLLFRKGIEWTGTDAPFPAYCMSRTNCCNIYNITKFKDELEKRNGCDTGVISVFEMDKKLESKMIVSPNPAENEVQINWNTELTSTGLSIFSFSGEKVYKETLNNNSSNQRTIQTAHWEAGIYFAQLQTASGVLSKRIVISR